MTSSESRTSAYIGRLKKVECDTENIRMGCSLSWGRRSTAISVLELMWGVSSHAPCIVMPS